jgi:hypothetical protein
MSSFNFSVFYNGLHKQKLFKRLPSEIFQIVKKYHHCWKKIDKYNNYVNSKWLAFLLNSNLLELKGETDNGYVYHVKTLISSNNLHNTNCYLRLPYKDKASRVSIPIPYSKKVYVQVVRYKIPKMIHIPQHLEYHWDISAITRKNILDSNIHGPPIMDINGFPFCSVRLRKITNKSKVDIIFSIHRASVKFEYTMICTLFGDKHCVPKKSSTNVGANVVCLSWHSFGKNNKNLNLKIEIKIVRLWQWKTRTLVRRPDWKYHGVHVNAKKIIFKANRPLL